ncbi:alpha/beta fold hydrolase [Listeria monocytogenes]|uniref:alpha/beta hydrolase n=1 Tax=Listeria monocytogenes TaxID=1639 RepID=UPI000CDADEC4|nr:carboxylesterase [Listeria monocytogenes]EAG4937929.1 alpha/beta fold hydrolase [Listeria monocytogenes]EAG4947065.1 alpha/beta fold hydrolase [Listeria monocytogenes]EAG4956124.1 alpha/beta fold hydrolase [Listeria monocytogenes]POQ29195.1 carboxylesterase [Listeria monocytogenes]
MSADRSFTLKAGNRAVLLLHGFAGTTEDVRELGEILAENGYTVHAPNFRGHGDEPAIFLKTTPEMWYEDAVAGYRQLEKDGYNEIAIVGVTMGGVFALKMAESFSPKAIVPLCANVNRKMRYIPIENYLTKQLKKQGIVEQEADQMLKNYLPEIDVMTEARATFYKNVARDIEKIHVPTMIGQGCQDEEIDADNANYIFKHIHTNDKQLCFYAGSGHDIVNDCEKDILEEDLIYFLDDLVWLEEKVV